MISVLYLTHNIGGLDILEDNLKRQTHKDFETIVIDELYPRKALKEWIYFKPKPKKGGNVRNLNSAYNEGIKLIKGELTVFLQDYIWIPDDGLEKLWEWYEIYGDDAAFATGGYGAEKPDWKEYRAGCLKPYQYTAQSVANDKNGVEKIDYRGYEINFASFPSGPLKEIEFDEKWDAFYGGDNNLLAKRAEERGMRFFIDYDIKKVGFPEYFKRPKDFEEKHIINLKKYGIK